MHNSGVVLPGCPIALSMKEQLGTDKANVYADHVCVGLQKYRIPFRARMFILNSIPAFQSTRWPS